VRNIYPDRAHRGRALKDRRRFAADALDLQAGTFRKNDEPALVHDVAVEICRSEHGPGHARTVT
jgi:hypothetical protein